MYCVDVFTDTLYEWMRRYNAKKKTGPYGIYYTLETDKKGKNIIIHRVKNSGIKYRIYDKKWERSSDYRTEFFKHYKAPYRCRYCHKKLKRTNVVVDHLIPIGKVKTSTFARTLLYLRGICTVNDYRNLVPACSKCNRKKSDKMGFWIVKGYLGKFKLYWIIRKFVWLGLFVLLFYFISICYVNSILC